MPQSTSRNDFLIYILAGRTVFVRCCLLFAISFFTSVFWALPIRPCNAALPVNPISTTSCSALVLPAHASKAKHQKGVKKLLRIVRRASTDWGNTKGTLFFFLDIGLAIGLTAWAINLIIAGIYVAGIGILLLELGAVLFNVLWILKRG